MLLSSQLHHYTHPTASLHTPNCSCATRCYFPSHHYYLLLALLVLCSPPPPPPQPSPRTQRYCNVEGVAWIDAERLVFTSDKAKKTQNYR